MPKTSRRALIIDPKDSVANALEEVQAGEEIAARSGSETITLKALERIPFGFKVSPVDLSPGDLVFKYGEVIGKASQPIARGALIHVHNIEGSRGRGDLTHAESK